MTADIAVVGSLNIDVTIPVTRLPAPGETVLASAPSRSAFGGKGGNQAAAAAALGASVTMVGRVGADEHGREILADLARRGIDTSGVAATAGTRSGTATIAVDEAGDNIILVDPGANSCLTPADVSVTAVRTAATVLIQLEIPGEAVTTAIRSAAGRVILNPAPARALSTALLEDVDVLVPNAGELGLLASAASPQAVPDVIRLVRKLGLPGDVVVTLGSDGALAVLRDAGRVVRVPAAPAHVTDTTGAGDCFCGALAVWLSDGADLADAVRYAVAAASLSTTAPGARGGLPDRAATEALAAQLSVLAVRPE